MPLEPVGAQYVFQRIARIVTELDLHELIS
jgi:hypothetical protein